MKLTENLNPRILLYLKVGLAWFILWLLIYILADISVFLYMVPNEIWRCIFIFPVNYMIFEKLVPFIRKKRRYIIPWVLIGIVTVFFIAMVLSFGAYWWRQLGVAIGIHTEMIIFENPMKGVEYQVQFTFFSVLFFGVIVHAHDYTKLKQATQQLRIEKQSAELNYLKSQTNPHFLFNTLNNIYSLARDKSDRAPESILRLSKILRFMLYETGSDYISLEQELKIITDYIELEKLRYDESLTINFNYNIEDKKQAIPPLLLIPLVENAFKHGVSETRGHPFIDIHLTVNRQQLYFVVKNSTESAGEKIVKENIGLSNLRRQLELLYTDHSLEIDPQIHSFTATLKINLATHV
jgi:two-component system, LytTR family, sensor kinase